MAGMLADSRDYPGFDQEWANGNAIRRMIRRKVKRQEANAVRRAINEERSQ
jgi:hypothetical protein